MNRSNVGNIVTNATQIMSVGATAASGVIRSLGSADTALSNLSKQEKAELGQVRADKLRDEVSRYKTGGDSSLQHLSEEELTKYRQVQADDIRKFSDRDSVEGESTVDDYMADVKSSYTDNSEQVKHIVNKLTSDRDFLNNWTEPVDTDFIDDLVNKGEI